MNLYTIGFTQKNAQEFFTLLEHNRVELLIDVRLNNKSQLASFTKDPDLKFFLSKISNVQYAHDISFAPTKELLDNYKKKLITWETYEAEYNDLITKRKIERAFTEIVQDKYQNVCLLCSEPTPEHCHRRLMAEYLKRWNPTIQIIHI
ncbi:DUF488 family protein [Candidatus Avelusimicrobium luingense]|uniref:DUF488 domain-containing protein n=1 Tax=Candidatus Avelusimicrobium luingense TaxID=3416211 RepID=UPI003D0AE176